MRSRASHARALLRIAAGSASAGSSTSAGSAATHQATVSHHGAASAAAAAAAAAAGARQASTSSSRPASPLAGRTRSFNSRRRLAVARQAAASGSSSPAPTSSSAAASARAASSSGSLFSPPSFSSAIANARGRSYATQHAASSLASGEPLASPPPHSLPSIAWESFFSDERPLLEHETLSGQDGSAKLNLQAAAHEASEALLSVLKSAGGAGADIESGSFPFAVLAPVPSWKRRIGRIDSERFATLLDRLGNASSESKLAAARLVESEAKRLEEEERFAAEREEAVAAALERGEDPAAAKKLGSEADLIILGEPEGAHPEWARGVASHLVEKTRAFEAPEPPSVEASKQEASVAEIEDAVDGMIVHFQAVVIDGASDEMGLPSNSLSSSSSSAASATSKALSDPSSSQSSKTTLFVSDDDPNLFLSHAMVQASLPGALAWDRLVAKMDAAASGNEELARNVINVSKLDAKLFEGADEDDMLLGEKGSVDMDSVKRKRRKKMRKHKYRKLRKATRVERRRKA